MNLTLPTRNMSVIKIGEDNKMLNFLSLPQPLFTSLQQREIYLERVMFSKTSIVFNSIVEEIFNEWIFEDLTEELKLISEETMDFEEKSMELSYSSISKNSSMHTISTNDVNNLYQFRNSTLIRTVNYIETSSDSEDDEILFSQYIPTQNWTSFLKKELEFNHDIFGVITTSYIPINTYLGFYGGKLIEKLSTVSKILKGPRPHYILELKKNKLWIDGNPKHNQANIFGIINHHCTDVNIVFVKISSTKIAVKTCKNIDPNKYLHADYRITHTILNETRTFIPCQCHINCTNFI